MRVHEVKREVLCCYVRTICSALWRKADGPYITTQQHTATWTHYESACSSRVTC